MLRNRAIFVGFGDGPQDPKNSLEIQGFVPAFWGRRRACGFDLQEQADVAGDDLTVSGMTGRYARALFELALDTKSVDAVKTDLEKFDAMLSESPDLLRLVRSPVFGVEEQSKALSAVLEKAGIGGLAAKFLKLITANRRLFAVRNMIRDFRKLTARWKGEVTAEVTVAEKLSDARLEELKNTLKSITGEKSIDLNVKIDPAIIGGLTVKLGSRMVDSSLRTKLNAMKLAMKEAR